MKWRKMAELATPFVAWFLVLSCQDEAVCVEGSICVEDYADIEPSTDSEAFTIQFVFTDTVSEETKEAANAAARRLEEIIVRGLSPVGEITVPADRCWGNPEVTVTPGRGVVMFVNEFPISGRMGFLGGGGPCGMRSDGMPYGGRIKIDADDVADLSKHGKLADLLAHEMLHCLGFGTLWNNNGLIVEENEETGWFTGFQATLTYRYLGGKGEAVPTYGTGHWNGLAFDHELMFGSLSYRSPNPIGPVTVASLIDIGYTVNMLAADSVTLRKGSDVPVSVNAL